MHKGHKIVPETYKIINTSCSHISKILIKHKSCLPLNDLIPVIMDTQMKYHLCTETIWENVVNY